MTNKYVIVIGTGSKTEAYWVIGPFESQVDAELYTQNDPDQHRMSVVRMDEPAADEAWR